jgi:hypothetical protein
MSMRQSSERGLKQSCLLVCEHVVLRSAARHWWRNFEAQEHRTQPRERAPPAPRELGRDA